MPHPVAYLRRSRVDTRKPGAVSHEGQIAAVRDLAAKHGDDPDALVILEDWGKSGRAARQHLRGQFAELERMIRDGEATAVYAFSASRLARSLEGLARLAKLCAGMGIPIRCADGYSPDVSSATGRMVLGILGSVYEWQAEWTGERGIEGADIRRANGSWIGPAPWGKKVVGGQLVDNPGEDVEDVVAAYREAGTYQGAARLLATRGVKTRRNGWAASSVKSILKTARPELVSLTVRQGRPPTRHRFTLTGLLRCSCGATLTGKVERGGTISYQCQKAGEMPNHPRPRSVAESRVLPWVENEALLYLEPEDDRATRARIEEERSELTSQRDRVRVAFIDGLMERAEALRLAGDIDAKLSSLPATDPAPPPRTASGRIDLSEIIQSRDVNAGYRRLFRYIAMGTDLRPARAEWRNPAWRGEPRKGDAPIHGSLYLAAKRAGARRGRTKRPGLACRPRTNVAS